MNKTETHLSNNPFLGILDRIDICSVKRRHPQGSSRKKAHNSRRRPSCREFPVVCNPRSTPSPSWSWLPTAKEFHSFKRLSEHFYPLDRLSIASVYLYRYFQHLIDLFHFPWPNTFLQENSLKIPILFREKKERKKRKKETKRQSERERETGEKELAYPCNGFVRNPS